MVSRRILAAVERGEQRSAKPHSVNINIVKHWILRIIATELFWSRTSYSIRFFMHVYEWAAFSLTHLADG